MVAPFKTVLRLNLTFDLKNSNTNKVNTKCCDYTSDFGSLHNGLIKVVHFWGTYRSQHAIQPSALPSLAWKQSQNPAMALVELVSWCLCRQGLPYLLVNTVVWLETRHQPLHSHFSPTPLYIRTHCSFSCWNPQPWIKDIKPLNVLLNHKRHEQPIDGDVEQQESTHVY